MMYFCRNRRISGSKKLIPHNILHFIYFPGLACILMKYMQYILQAPMLRAELLLPTSTPLPLHPIPSTALLTVFVLFYSISNAFNLINCLFSVVVLA